MLHLSIKQRSNFVNVNQSLGNKSLARVLPQVYAENKDPIQHRIGELVRLLPDCEPVERNSLLKLLAMVAKDKPSVSLPIL